MYPLSNSDHEELLLSLKIFTFCSLTSRFKTHTGIRKDLQYLQHFILRNYSAHTCTYVNQHRCKNTNSYLYMETLYIKIACSQIFVNIYIHHKDDQRTMNLIQWKVFYAINAK